MIFKGTALHKCSFPLYQGTSTDSRQQIQRPAWSIKMNLMCLWINLDIGNGIDFFLSLCLMVHYRFRFKAPKFLTGWVLRLAMLVFMDCCGHTRLRRILLWILSRGRGGDPGAPRLVYVPAHWLGERIFLLSGILPCFFYCHADILWFCQCNSPERS